MKKRVADLSDAELDLFVARGEQLVGAHIDETDVCVHLTKSGYTIWMPTQNWNQAGPIIEREAFALIPVMGGGWHAEWDTPTGGDDRQEHYMEGSTPLIAAMRCYVASKFGDEVEVPEAK